MKQTLETIRSQLGPDWLPSLTAKQAYEPATSHAAPLRETDDDIYLNDSLSINGEAATVDAKVEDERDAGVTMVTGKEERQEVVEEGDAGIAAVGAESDDVIVWNRTESVTQEYEGMYALVLHWYMCPCLSTCALVLVCVPLS